MEMGFRWYGQLTPSHWNISVKFPGMKGIVTAIYDIPVGESWPLDKINELKQYGGRSWFTHFSY